MYKAMKYIFNAIAVAYIPFLMILSFFPKATDGFISTPYGLNLLFFFLYSFPFYCVFLEIGFTVERAYDSNERTIADRIIHSIRIVLAAGILITLINLDEWLYLSLALAVALIAFWIVSAIMFRKNRKTDELFKKKSFWICVVAVLVIVCGGMAIIQGVIDSKNQVDLVGGGLSEITGSIVYFYGDDETAMDVFYSSSDETKKITLSRDKTYKIGLRPSFQGSRVAIFTGDCAEFTYDDGNCAISYVGEQEHQPTYALTVTAQDDFQLKIEVDGYEQAITICVAEEGE